ncbi:unnamed protein product [Sympodiomycopsis kandeliae]
MAHPNANTDTTASQISLGSVRPGYDSQYLTTAATTVALHSLAWAGGAGVLGSITGVLRYDPALPPIVLANRGARNAFVIAFPFYAIREYAITPILYQLDPQSPPQPQSYTTNLLATSISGASVGSILAYYKSRPILQNSIRLGVITTTFQLINNAWKVRRNHTDSNTAEDVVAEEFPSSAAAQQPSSSPTSHSPSWWDKLKENAPIRKIPDERYLEQLEKRRDELKLELKELIRLEEEYQAQDGKDRMV